MQITFDHQIFYLQKYGGISRYFSELAREIGLHPNLHVKINAPLSKNYYLKKLRSDSGGTQCSRVVDFRGRGRLQKALAKVNYAWSSRADIIHETYYSPVGYGYGRSRIITVYDMIHELFPSNFSPSDTTSTSKKIAVNRADHIICISHATKNDLIKLMNINPRKISVVHLATSVGARITDKSNHSVEMNRKPFFLYVGTRRGYKNFARVCSALSNSRKLKTSFQLVAFGGGDFDRYEKGFLENLNLTGIVKHVDGDDFLLEKFYSEAVALIYPSLYEGFGLPPLEAMNLGCPVICSQTSSIPEVVGDAGLYFDPYSTEDIKSAMEKVATSESTRSNIVAKGFAQRKRFSWEKCAQQTLSVYTDALEGKFNV